MIPILYESSEILFNSNGLGRLRDCVSCVVTEERNGVYECDFEYPVNGQNYEEILFGRIIAVEHDDSGDVQPFDIVSATKPINGVVQFHAVHISYRLHGCVTPSGVSNVTSMSQALTTLGQYQPTPRLFSFSSDKTSTGYVAAFDGAPKTIRSVLGGVEGSILDAYGGEYEWDKFNVILHEARGTDTGFSIRYGVNMIDYNDDTDYSETYSSVIPFWMNSSDGTVIRGNRVVSSISSPIGRDMCIPLDLSDKFDSQPTTAQLESMAASILSGIRKSWTPNFSSKTSRQSKPAWPNARKQERPGTRKTRSWQTS